MSSLPRLRRSRRAGELRSVLHLLPRRRRSVRRRSAHRRSGRERPAGRGRRAACAAGYRTICGSLNTSSSSRLCVENSETIAPSGPAWNQCRVSGGIVYCSPGRARSRRGRRCGGCTVPGGSGTSPPCRGRRRPAGAGARGRSGSGRARAPSRRRARCSRRPRAAGRSPRAGRGRSRRPRARARSAGVSAIPACSSISAARSRASSSVTERPGCRSPPTRRAPRSCGPGAIGVGDPEQRLALAADRVAEVLQLEPVGVLRLQLDALGLAVAAQLERGRLAVPRIVEEDGALAADRLELVPIGGAVPQSKSASTSPGKRSMPPSAASRFRSARTRPRPRPTRARRRGAASR